MAALWWGNSDPGGAVLGKLWQSPGLEGIAPSEEEEILQVHAKGGVVGDTRNRNSRIMRAQDQGLNIMVAERVIIIPITLPTISY